jgi:hypothetical protein
MLMPTGLICKDVVVWSRKVIAHVAQTEHTHLGWGEHGADAKGDRAYVIGCRAMGCGLLWAVLVKAFSQAHGLAEHLLPLVQGIDNIHGHEKLMAAFVQLGLEDRQRNTPPKNDWERLLRDDPF